MLQRADAAILIHYAKMAPADMLPAADATLMPALDCRHAMPADATPPPPLRLVSLRITRFAATPAVDRHAAAADRRFLAAELDADHYVIAKCLLPRRTPPGVMPATRHFHARQPLRRHASRAAADAAVLLISA